MAKKRVHEIAKERGIQSKEALAILQKAGVSVTTASSSVEEADAARAFGNGASAVPAAEPVVEAPAPAAQPQPDGDGAGGESGTADGAQAAARPGTERPGPSRQGGSQRGGPQQAGDQRPRAPIQRPPTPEGDVRRAGPAGRGPRILQDAPPPDQQRQPGGHRAGSAAAGARPSVLAAGPAGRTVRGQPAARLAAVPGPRAAGAPARVAERPAPAGGAGAS